MVCIEDLQVQNMSKSAAGSTEQPGRNVRAKSELNKSILDQGWFEFRRQLDYKPAWRGGRLVAVPPQNTSRTCPRCKHVSADNRQTQARFACVQCGFEENADGVGAINILSRGIKIWREKGGTRPDGLWIEPQWRSEAGTHRSDSGAAQPHLSTVGISGLQAGEDVNQAGGRAPATVILNTNPVAVLPPEMCP